MATPLNRSASVAFGHPGRLSPRGKNALPMLPKVPPPASSSPMFVPCLREGESGVAKTEPTLPKRHRRPAFRPARLAVRVSGRVPPRKFPRRFAHNGTAFRSFEPVCRPSVRLVDYAGEMAKAPLPTWRVAQLTRHARFFLRPTSQHPGGNYPWRPCQDSASCRFLVRSGLCPRKWPWRLCKSDDSP